jgi:hypothetical protein
MNWYRLLKLAQIRGEFWITESGQVMGAGDEGDYNHEGHVIEQIRGYWADDMDWDEFKKEQAIQQLKNDGYSDDEIEMVQQDKNQWYRAQEKALDNLGISPEEQAIAEGRGDARKYAMEKWGWKRLEGRSVETWLLRSQDLKAIANGLYDAYDDEVETGTFTIYVQAAKTWFTDIPYNIIEQEDPMAIHQFDSQIV